MSKTIQILKEFGKLTLSAFIIVLLFTLLYPSFGQYQLYSTYYPDYKFDILAFLMIILTFYVYRFVSKINNKK